jgi:hypothetical protein
MKTALYNAPQTNKKYLFKYNAEIHSPMAIAIPVIDVLEIDDTA